MMGWTFRPPVCEMPPMKASPTHTVLIETMLKSWPLVSTYVPGFHVLMPYYHEAPDYPEAKTKWTVINQTLHSFIQNPVKSSHEIQDRIMSYNKTYKTKWRFDVLHYIVQEVLSEEARAELLQVTLPSMARLALELPQLLPRPLPLLRSGHGAHVSLSQRQVASLLAHAFFCTYPRRNNPYNQFANYPSINFNGLYQYHHGRSNETSEAKLLCILNYFQRVTAKSPEGTLTFSRRCIPLKNQQPEWKNSSKLLRLSGLHVHHHGSIEFDGTHMLQVTFANKMYGGGVLDSGSVQEEIRCITCPEMIVTRLFTEKLADNEALLITGVERYCDYKGYADSFRFTGDFVDKTPRDANGRMLCSVVAIDALNFSSTRVDPQSRSRVLRFLRRCFGFRSQSPPSANFPSVNDQYYPRLIDRELNKAYVGFENPEFNNNLSPVATGNWGCGVFNGDPTLKFMLQLLASTQAERDMHFFTFNNDKTLETINEIQAIMMHRNYTVGKVYSVLTQYHKQHRNGKGLLEYLRKELRGKRSAVDDNTDYSTGKRVKMTNVNLSWSEDSDDAQQHNGKKYKFKNKL